MKSEAFFSAIPSRAVDTVHVADQSDSKGGRILPLACLMLTIVCGGIGLNWEQISLAHLSFQTEEERLHEKESLLQERRHPVFNLRVSARGDYLCFRTLKGEVYRLSLSETETETEGETAQINLFPGRYCNEFQLSPVADQMVVCFTDGGVILQSLDATFSSQVLFEPDSEGIDGLAYSPDGRLVAGVSGEGFVIVWNAQTGSQVTVIRRSKDSVSSLAFDSELGLLVSFESGIEHWLIEPYQKSGDRYILDWKLPGHPPASKMLVSPDRRFVTIANHYRAFAVWDLKRREKLWEIDESLPTLRGLLSSRDSRSVFNYSVDNEFVQYDLLTGEEISYYRDSELRRGTGGETSPAGDVIYTGSSDGFIRSWSAKDYTLIRKIDTATL